MNYWNENLPYLGSSKDQGGIMTFDGDGRTAKRLNRSLDRHFGNTTWLEYSDYYIYSSVTGQKIASLTTTGQKNQTFVYMGGSVIAEQIYRTGGNNEVVFKQSDPVTGSDIQTDLSGELTAFGAIRSDFEPLGAVVPAQEEEEVTTPEYQKGGHTHNPESGC